MNYNCIENNALVAKYGLIELSIIDVTEELLKQCIIDGKLIINKNFVFNRLKHDPLPNIVKKLYVSYKTQHDDWKNIEINEYRTSDIILDISHLIKNAVDSITNNSLKKIEDINSNIVIYPHGPYSEDDGGINVMYYLAKVLTENNKNVRMYPTYGSIKNNIFNNYYKSNEFDLTGSIVIYCEGTIGNPLNSKYVIRWLLSEIGKNVPVEYVQSFGKNELVYYFNTEHKIEEQPLLKNVVYKLLSLLYLNPIYTNNNLSTRNGWCFTKRKISYHSHIVKIHPEDAYEFSKRNVQTNKDFSYMFNEYKYFVSYDPLTFHTFNAAMCGCISIVHPIYGMNKTEWMKTTALTEYFNKYQEEKLYGIAYGIEELEWATNTIHLASDQIKKIVNYFKENHVPSFINDLECIIKGQILNNTIQNNFFIDNSTKF